jgi:hypothetical protein
LNERSNSTALVPPYKKSLKNTEKSPAISKMDNQTQSYPAQLYDETGHLNPQIEALLNLQREQFKRELDARDEVHQATLNAMVTESTGEHLASHAKDFGLFETRRTSRLAKQRQTESDKQSNRKSRRQKHRSYESSSENSSTESDSESVKTPPSADRRQVNIDSKKSTKYEPNFKYLPPPGDRGAPTVFNGPEDDAEEWLDRFESVAKRGKLLGSEKCEFILDYAALEVKQVIKALLPWEERDWRALKKEIIQLYPYHTRSCQFTERDLRKLCTDWSQTEIEVDVQLEEYIREFLRISNFLLKKDIIDIKERDYFFCSGFNRGLQRRIEHEIKWLDVHEARRYEKKRSFPFDMVLRAVRSLFEENQFESINGATHSERVKEFERTRKEEREVEILRHKERLSTLAKTPAEYKTLCLPPIEAPMRREFQITAPFDAAYDPRHQPATVPSVIPALPKPRSTETELLAEQLSRLSIGSQEYATL